MGGDHRLGSHSSSCWVTPGNLENISTNLVWALTKHHQGMIMSILTPKRSPCIVSQQLRACEKSASGGSRTENETTDLSEKFKREAVYLSRLPIVTLLSGAEVFVLPGSESLLLSVCKSPIRPPPLALTSWCCPQESSHTSLPRLIHFLQILLLPVFFFTERVAEITFNVS